jgi:hypothetical protein
MVMTAQQARSTINRLHNQDDTKPFIAKARGGEGVGTVGLYIEVITIRDMQPVRHTRYFVYGSTLYAASRSAGESKAGWKPRKTPSVHDALDLIDEITDRVDTKVFGRPILVELKADDISALEAGQVPGARFRGQYRVEKEFGKFDFSKGSDRIQYVPFNYNVTKAVAPKVVAGVSSAASSL